MSLEAILEKIRNESQEERDLVLSEARSRGDAIEESARQRAGQIVEEARKAAEEKASELKRRARTLADLESRKTVLSAKMAAIEEAFRAAVKSLEEMPAAEYRELLVRVVSEAASGDESVIASPRDRERLGQEFLDEVNAALKLGGKPGKLRFSEETRDMVGGVVLASERLQVNLTLDAVLARLKDEMVPRIASILFEKESRPGDGREGR